MKKNTFDCRAARYATCRRAGRRPAAGASSAAAIPPPPARRPESLEQPARARQSNVFFFMYAARFARRHGRAPVRDRGHPEVRRGAPPERARQHVAPRPPLDGPELQSHAHHTVCKSNFRADSSVDLRSGITKKFSGRNALPRGRYRRTAVPEPAAVWNSNFGRPTPSTRCCLRSCVCSMAWSFQAMDATLSPVATSARWRGGSRRSTQYFSG